MNLHVCRTWNRLASDNSVWRSLFTRRRVDGWDVDLRRLRRSTMTAAARFASEHRYSKRRRTIPAPLELDWYNVYKTRAELSNRWNGNAFINAIFEDKENARTWEPVIKRLEGHRDRCACSRHACNIRIAHTMTVYIAQSSILHASSPAQGTALSRCGV